MTDHEPETIESLRLKNQLLQDMLEKKAAEYNDLVEKYDNIFGQMMTLHAEMEKAFDLAMKIR